MFYRNVIIVSMKYCIITLMSLLLLSCTNRVNNVVENNLLIEHDKMPVFNMVEFKWNNLPILPFIKYDKELIFRHEIEHCFDNKVFCSDMLYWTPPLSWLETDVVPYFRNYLEHLDIKYSNKFDCDDYARTLATFVHLKYYSNKTDKKMQAVAFGEVWYQRDPMFYGEDSHHAINVIILDNKEIFYFDPQSLTPVGLTPYEVNHIRLIKF